jgi:hypothetical protein
MPVQAFSRTPGSAVSLYSRSNGTNVGSQWKPQATNPGEELLMRTTLASGPDATDICPGGFAQHVFQGLSVSSGQTVALRTRTRTAKIRVLCPGATYGSCKGLMSLDTTFGNRDTGLGNISFDVPRGYPLNLVVKLSSAGVKLAQRARTLVANVNVSSHDDPKAGRAKPGIPVQSKITTANIRIKPDRLAVKKKKKH